MRIKKKKTLPQRAQRTQKKRYSHKGTKAQRKDKKMNKHNINYG